MKIVMWSKNTVRGSAVVDCGAFASGYGYEGFEATHIVVLGLAVVCSVSWVVTSL